MPVVQMQRVRSYANSEVVVCAVDLDLANNHEYLHALSQYERACADGEFVRTVGDDSPLKIRHFEPNLEDEQ